MSLGQKAVKGTIWVAGGTYVVQIINFAANIVLMWLLAPEHFGILALAMFFLTLGQKLGAFGFNHALIHKQDDLDRAVPAHQFLHLVTSFAVVILIVVFFPLISGWYDRLTATVLLFLSFSGVAQGIGHTPRILMEKELDFAPVMKVNIAATAVSAVVSLGMALAGAGVWTLVGRQLVADGVSAIGYFAVSGRKFRVRIDAEMFKWFYKFGAYLWVAGMATMVTLRFDDFLVGTMIDTETLGYYARAYWLACLPTVMIAHVVAKVAFPLYSKVQKDRERLSEAFSTAMRGIVLVTLPLSVGLAILAPEFVMIVFGEKWMSMVPLLQLLLIYASLRPVFDNTGELFTAVGKPKIAGMIILMQAVAVLLLCPVAIYLWKAGGAAVSVGLAMALGVVIAYRELPRYVNISFLRLFAAPAIAACAGACFVLVGQAAITIEGDLARFLFKGLLFLLGYVAVLGLIQGRRVIEDGRKLVSLLKADRDKE